MHVSAESVKTIPEMADITIPVIFVWARMVTAQDTRL